MQAFHEFRSHVDEMINNINVKVYQRNTSKEKFKKKLKHPTVQTNGFFQSFHKDKSLGLRLLLLVSFGKQIISLSVVGFYDTH